MNLNKVFVLGNLTRDPEKRSLPSGQPVAAFGMATNRFYTNQNNEKQQDTEFHNITVFGKLADIAAQYLQKGSMVLVEGRLRTRNWQDAQGVKHYRTEIIADNIQFGPKFQSSSRSAETLPPSGHNINHIRDEDIPVIEKEPAPQQEGGKENPGTGNKPASLTNEPAELAEDEEEIDVRKIPF